MLKFRCEACGQKLGVPDKFAGKMIRCPKCSDPTSVPEAEPRLEDDIAPAGPTSRNTPGSSPGSTPATPRRNTPRSGAGTRSGARPSTPAQPRPAQPSPRTDKPKPSRAAAAPALNDARGSADDSGLALLSEAEGDDGDANALLELEAGEAATTQLPPALRPPAPRPTAKQKKPRKTRGPVDDTVPLWMIFVVPFMPDAASIALRLAVISVIWVIGLPLALARILEPMNSWSIEARVRVVNWVFVILLLTNLAWTTKRYFATVAHFATGERYDPGQRSLIVDLLRSIVVTLTAMLPVIVPFVVLVIILVATVDPPTAPTTSRADPSEAARTAQAVGFIAGNVLGIFMMLYWPMGMGLAAAFGTLNPLKVVQKIYVCIGPYLLVLAFISAFIAVCSLGTGGVMILLQDAKMSPQMKLALALALPVLLLQYMFVGCLASVGVLLRRYRFR